ncbi:MAG: redoxin domain-containing protein, partial [Planctomycetaceae bacterium]|nr:redoxin domain-containing protein [Planctomycetaceae bacterium]
PEMQELLSALQKIDESHPSVDGTPRDLVRWNVQRADVIERLIAASQTADERGQWIRQFADGVGAAVQTGQYDEGLQRLIKLQDAVKADRALLGYVSYRRLLAEYAVRLKTDDQAAREEAQKWWLSQLEAFVEQWPNAEDSVEAIIQLAISLEFMGRIDDAKAWYTRLAKDFAQTDPGVRARGALKRLTLTGTPVDLAGRNLNGQPLTAAQYKGKVLLVVFWASWATPFTEELPVIAEIYEKYRGQGFEILGVNLDTENEQLAQYIRQQKITWQNLREPGGIDGSLAHNYGIISVPTMFVVNKDGIVAAGSIATRNLEHAVQLLLKGEALPTGTAPTTTPTQTP